MALQQRQKILSVVRNLFLTRGYYATSMSDICGAAGLSKGAIYHHFPHKASIASEIVRMDMLKLKGILNELSGLDAKETIRQFFLQCQEAAMHDRNCIGNALIVLGWELAGECGGLADELRRSLNELVKILSHKSARPHEILAGLIAANGLARMEQVQPFDVAADLLS